MPKRSDPKYLAADGFKCCKRCERVLPVEQFYKKSGSADGFQHTCKECSSDRGRELYQENRDARIAYATDYARRNQEQVRATRAEWYERVGHDRAKRRWAETTPEERTELAAQQRAMRAASPMRFKRLDLKRRLRKLGVTLEEYDALFEAQGGVCAICLGPPNGKSGDLFHIDHDHGTGALRGLLCHYCNTSLGGFRDSTEYLKRAIDYLGNPPFRRIAERTLF